MTGNKSFTEPDWIDPDDAPDLSQPPWPAQFAAVPVQRGRPKSANAKVSTTIRLDPDIVQKFREQGPGWQTRINDVLRDWLKRA